MLKLPQKIALLAALSIPASPMMAAEPMAVEEAAKKMAADEARNAVEDAGRLRADVAALQLVELEGQWSAAAKREKPKS